MAAERLTLALLKMRITRALRDMQESCRKLDLAGAERAEQEMNEGLDDLCKRLHVRTG